MKLTSKRFYKIAVMGVISLAAFVNSAKESLSDPSFVEYRRLEIRSKPSGVYESADFVFFHQRNKITHLDSFAAFEAESDARYAAMQDVFKWIDRHAVSNGIPSSVLSFVKRLNESFSVESCKIIRSLDLASRTFDCEMDGKEFVFTMVINKGLLMAEAAKGLYSERSRVILNQWNQIVRTWINQTNQVVFLRKTGAMDLLTLSAEQRQGVELLSLKTHNAKADCLACIEKLRGSVLNLQGDAEKEYAFFLEKLPQKLDGEMSRVESLCKHERLCVMILSFASCLQSREMDRMKGLKALRSFGLRSKPISEIRDLLIDALAETPGSVLLWAALGETFGIERKERLALSCFRNALRLDLKNAYVMDRMAKVYEHIGCKRLARGLALLAHGLSENEGHCKNSVKILGLR